MSSAATGRGANAPARLQEERYSSFVRVTLRR